MAAVAACGATADSSIVASKAIVSVIEMLCFVFTILLLIVSADFSAAYVWDDRCNPYNQL